MSDDAAAARRPLLPYFLDDEVPGPPGYHPDWDDLVPPYMRGRWSTGSMHYGYQCQPISMRQWCALFALQERLIARTPIVGLREIAEVSTVWLGNNMRFYGDGDPLVFESMVFGGPLDGETVRYSYWHDATAGHAELVRLTELDLFAVDPLPRKGRRSLDEAARELGVDLEEDDAGPARRRDHPLDEVARELRIEFGFEEGDE